MPLALPSSRSTRRSSTKASVAACGATNGSSPSPMCAAEPPMLFSRCARANWVPGALPVSTTSLATNGGGCSSAIGSEKDSAGTGSSRRTGGLSIVASSYVSAASSASTWIDGGACEAAAAFRGNGLPQSKQNLAAGGFSAPHWGQGFSAGRAAASTGSRGLARGDGGGAGGGRLAGGEAADIAAPAATRTRPVEGGGTARPGAANGSGGVLSTGEPFPMVNPASAASSSEMASARSSSERVSGTCVGGVNASGGVLSADGCPVACVESGAPQLPQTLRPGSLYASQRMHTSPSDPASGWNSMGGSSSRSGARHRLHSKAESSFSLP